MSGPEVTVVIVTFRAADFIEAALTGLQAQTRPHRLLVIDNHSTDGTAEVLARSTLPGQVLRMTENLGFAGGVAAALPQIDTRFFALLNDDAVPAPDWLDQLLTAAHGDERAAAWTSLMVLADRPDTVNNVGSTLNDRWYGVDVAAGRPIAEIPSGVQDVFGFCGGAALLRTAAVRAIGGFPAAFFLYYEDLDTSWRLRRAGWEIRLVPAARVAHRHAATSDPHSELFHYFNERNRLLTLVRCAPPGVAVTQFARFVLTTFALVIRRLIGQAVPDVANFRTGLRFRVWRDALIMMPAQVLRRRPALRD